MLTWWEAEPWALRIHREVRRLRRTMKENMNLMLKRMHPPPILMKTLKKTQNSLNLLLMKNQWKMLNLHDYQFSSNSAVEIFACCYNFPWWSYIYIYIQLMVSIKLITFRVWIRMKKIFGLKKCYIYIASSLLGGLHTLDNVDKYIYIYR